MIAFLAACLMMGAASEQQDVPAAHVLVVVNRSDPLGVAVAEYYRERRFLSQSQVVFLDVSRSDNIGYDEYKQYVEKPVLDAISKLDTRIDYIVTTHGVPLEVGIDDPADKSQGLSLDAFLAASKTNVVPIRDKDDRAQVDAALNPYFGSTEHFSSAKFGLYLVTRIDGESVEDCVGLIESSLGAKASPGPFCFAYDPAKDSSGYGEFEKLLHDGDERLSSQKWQTVSEAPNRKPMMGYVGWGNNDQAFDHRSFRSLRFLPGALADLYVSGSARTFKLTNEGTAQITELVHQGVTGAKGYVSEPYLIGLSHPDVLFERYVSGFNLAESFYAATPLLKWKDVVVGDPLCNPFGHGP